MSEVVYFKGVGFLYGYYFNADTCTAVKLIEGFNGTLCTRTDARFSVSMQGNKHEARKSTLPQKHSAQ